MNGYLRKIARSVLRNSLRWIAIVFACAFCGGGIGVLGQAAPEREAKAKSTSEPTLSEEDRGAGEEESSRAKELARQLTSSDRKERREAAYQLGRLGKKAAPALEELTRSLADDDDQVWAFSITAIARLGPAASKSVPALIREFGEDRRRYDEQILHRTAFALSRIGDAAGDQLIAALSHQTDEVREGAARALGLMPSSKSSRKAVPALVEKLVDDDEDVREQVMVALSAIGEPAVKNLVSALGQDSLRLRTGAAITLRKMGRAASEAAPGLANAYECETEVGFRAPALEALSRMGWRGEELLPWLLEALSSPDEPMQDAAINGLAAFKDRPELAVPPLILVLESGNEGEKARAARVLGTLGEGAEPAMDALLTALSGLKVEGAPENGEAPAGNDGSVFLDAITSIGPVGAPKLLESLKSIEPKDISDDRQPVLKAIRSLGPRALPHLKKGAQSEHASVRLASLVALVDLGDAAKSARDLLLEATKDQVPEIRGTAILGLQRSGLKAAILLPIMTEGAKDEAAAVRRSTILAIEGLKEEEAVAATLPILLNLLADSDEEVMNLSARALGSRDLQSAETIEPLIAALDTSSERGRVTAIEALGKQGAAAEAAVPGITKCLVSGSEEQRVVAARALGTIGVPGKQTLAELVKAIDQPESLLVQAAALAAFARLQTDPKLAVPVLRRGLASDSPKVRQPAIDALTALGSDALAAAPRLFELLETDEDGRGLITALRAIGPRDIKLLLGAMKNKDSYVRTFACSALGRLGVDAFEAIPQLKAARDDDSSSTVRRRAEEALDLIEKDIAAEAAKDKAAKE